MSAGVRSEHDTAGVIAPPPAIFAAGLLAGAVVHAVRPAPAAGRGVRLLFGLPLIAAGLGLGVWARQTMRAAGTPLRPTRPSTAVVSGGPYRLTRNPVYLAMSLIYAGLALLSGRTWAFLFLPGVLAVVQSGVVAREERYLEAKFGATYRDYRERVRRWL